MENFEKLKEIGERIKTLREIEEISAETLAKLNTLSLEDYLSYEAGEKDFSFTFLYKTAGKLGVDIAELLTGENPHLSTYSVERAGEGLPINRRHGFSYLHIASRIKNRIAEPFIVTAPFVEKALSEAISLSVHDGQEMDFILSGSLKTVVDGKEEILYEGDCIYYDSGKPHGMIAASKEGCKFLAIVMKY